MFFFFFSPNLSSGGQETSEKAEERRGCGSEKATGKDGCRQGTGEGTRGGQEEGGPGSRCPVCARAFLQEVVVSCGFVAVDRPTRGVEVYCATSSRADCFGPHSSLCFCFTKCSSSSSSTSGGSFSVALCLLGVVRAGNHGVFFPRLARFLFAGVVLCFMGG